MGVVLVIFFFGYLFVVSMVCVPLIVRLGGERSAIEGDEAAKKRRRSAFVGSFLVAVVVHAAHPFALAVMAGEYRFEQVVLGAWMGPTAILTAIVGGVLLFVGRRRKNAPLLAATQGLAAALVAYTFLPLLELWLVDLVATPAPY